MIPSPPRKLSAPYVTRRPKETVYKLPEEFYLQENSALYQRARKICIRYGCCYAEARVKMVRDCLRRERERVERLYPGG
jgi:hypothetical protein